jgi:hypothetical protein
MEVRPRTSETRRPGCALLALLAAAGLCVGCSSGSDEASTKVESGGSPVASSVAPVPRPPDPIADPVEAFVELARTEGADERDLAISRCTIEQVQEFNGRGLAELIVRAKQAQLANQPLPPEVMPALGIFFQEAADCTRKQGGESGDHG